MKKKVAVLLAALTVCACIPTAAACGKKDEKVIKVGVTDYKPMDYRDDKGNWIGFDAELSEKVFTTLGYTVKFVEIDWETKVVTLNAKSIDVIWNGMTVTASLQEALCLSDVYLENRQYGLVQTKDAGSYTSAADLAGKKVAFEAGSAASDLIKNIECTKNDFTTQSAAVMEVAAGTSDVAVVDYTMATALTAQGSDYYGRLQAVDLGFEVEEYAIGFRKEDTALCASVNETIASLRASGYLLQLAQKYGVENLMKS